MSYISMFKAIVHELGHATVTRRLALRPLGICWPDIFNFPQADGTVKSIMHRKAEAVVGGIRESVAPNVQRYKPELIPQLLLVGAAGVTAEILVAGLEVTDETIAPVFAHRDQDGDHGALREMLGREPSAQDLLEACGGAGQLLAPLMPALVDEASALATAFETMAKHEFSGVLYEGSLDAVLTRILASGEPSHAIAVPA